MIILEKRYYGNGTNNADGLVTIRHYDEKPTNQYFYTDEYGEPIPEPNNEDEIGYTTNYSYDWRMRPVLVIENDKNNQPITHKLTWYDNLDRVILEAEYGTQTYRR